MTPVDRFKKQIQQMRRETVEGEKAVDMATRGGIEGVGEPRGGGGGGGGAAETGGGGSDRRGESLLEKHKAMLENRGSRRKGANERGGGFSWDREKHLEIPAKGIVDFSGIVGEAGGLGGRFSSSRR
jgi:hypothetical protein